MSRHSFLLSTRSTTQHLRMRSVVLAVVEDVFAVATRVFKCIGQNGYRAELCTWRTVGELGTLL